jgi:hypothetical protein
LNRWSYTQSNPVNHIDPSGHCFNQTDGTWHWFEQPWFGNCQSGTGTPNNPSTSTSAVTLTPCPPITTPQSPNRLSVNNILLARRNERDKDGLTTYWRGLTDNERSILTEGNWQEGSYNDFITRGGVSEPYHHASTTANGQGVIGATIFLYRAVSNGELTDIMNNQLFRPNPNGRSQDVKWFWETLDGAKGFKDYYELDTIVKVAAPDEVEQFASSSQANLDNFGPAISFIDEGLDNLNQLITLIEEVPPIP